MGQKTVCSGSSRETTVRNRPLLVGTPPSPVPPDLPAGRAQRLPPTRRVTFPNTRSARWGTKRNQGETGHVLPESGFILTRRSQEVGQGRTGFSMNLVGVTARLEEPSVVTSPSSQETTHGIDDRAYHRGRRPRSRVGGLACGKEPGNGTGSKLCRAAWASPSSRQATHRAAGGGWSALCPLVRRVISRPPCDEAPCGGCLRCGSSRPRSGYRPVR